MKGKLYIILFLFAVILSGFTQVKPPVKKVYAYKQASIPGVLLDHSDANDIKEKDAPKKPERKQNYNYWFYVEVPSSANVRITGLWINGKIYEFKSEPVTMLPVKKIVFTGLEKNDTTIMVPHTKNKIILVYPSAESKIIPHRIYAPARENELVITYSAKNKRYVTSIKSIKEINPDVRL